MRGFFEYWLLFWKSHPGWLLVLASLVVASFVFRSGSPEGGMWSGPRWLLYADLAAVTAAGLVCGYAISLIIRGRRAATSDDSFVAADSTSNSES